MGYLKLQYIRTPSKRRQWNGVPNMNININTMIGFRLEEPTMAIILSVGIPHLYRLTQRTFLEKFMTLPRKTSRKVYKRTYFSFFVIISLQINLHSNLRSYSSTKISSYFTKRHLPFDKMKFTLAGSLLCKRTLLFSVLTGGMKLTVIIALILLLGTASAMPQGVPWGDGKEGARCTENWMCVEGCCDNIGGTCVGGGPGKGRACKPL